MKGEKSVKHFATTLLFLSVFFLFNSAIPKEQHMQVRLYLATETEMLQLEKLGLNIAYIKSDEYVDVVATPEETNKLKLSGFKYEVIHDDLVEFYQSRLDKTKDMGGYHTYDEMVAALDSIHNEHPNITTAKTSIGTSVEGRTIWAMKISDNPDVDEDEPEVFYNGVIHACEPISIEVLLYFISYLTNNYGTDSVVTNIIDNRELWFVPIINPDGYVYNQTTNPNGGGSWRKNRRDNGDGSYGVELNRNFGYKWGYDNYGSSPNTSHPYYRGIAPFSEPETQAIRDFINSHDFIISMDYHSYSNLYFYPWGYIRNWSTNYKYPGDYLIFKEITDSLTTYNGYIAGPVYVANGTSIDWEYGDWSEKNKIISIVPEVGNENDGFWPPVERILPLCQENLGPNLYVARKAGELYNRPYRFFETQPNFIDTFLVSDDTIILNLRVVGHQLSGNITWAATDMDSFDITTMYGKQDTVINWLRIEPESGQVSSGGYFDHNIILDAVWVKSVSGAIIFSVTNGIAYDTIIVPINLHSIYLSGDANGDEKLSVSDVVYLINYLFKGGPKPDPIRSADANCDGKVTVSDVIYLINYLFKGGPKPDC
jgi:hypothetical protein